MLAGINGVAVTPKGLHYPSWSKWGNLRHASNAAFLNLMYAKHTTCTECIEFAKKQIDYALGSRYVSSALQYTCQGKSVNHLAVMPDRLGRLWLNLHGIILFYINLYY
jgi:hypothetical protein